MNNRLVCPFTKHAKTTEDIETKIRIIAAAAAAASTGFYGYNLLINNYQQLLPSLL